MQVRINVYAEELTPEVAIVEKVDESGLRFYGLRIFLESSKKLRHNHDEDDRSAITFWVKRTQKKGTDVSIIQKLVLNVLGRLTTIEELGTDRQDAEGANHG